MDKPQANKTPEQQYEESYGGVDMSPGATKKTVLTEKQEKAKEQLKKIELMKPSMHHKEEFSYHRIPKVFVPKSFIKFIRGYCKELDCSYWSFWQMIIIAAINHYLDTAEEKLQKLEDEKNRTGEIIEELKEVAEKKQTVTVVTEGKNPKLTVKDGKAVLEFEAETKEVPKEEFEDGNGERTQQQDNNETK